VYPMDLLMLWVDLGAILLEDSQCILWICWCSGWAWGLFYSRILSVSYGFAGVVGGLGGYFTRGFSVYPMDLLV